MLSLVVLPRYESTNPERAQHVLAIQECCVEQGQSTPPSAHAAITYTIPPDISYYRMYSAPRTGKTSRVCGVTDNIELELYIAPCRWMGMADTTVKSSSSSWTSEGIDAAVYEGEASSPTWRSRTRMLLRPPLDSCSVTVTLSGLLDLLDSADAQEGHQLVAATNEYSTSCAMPPRSRRYARGVHYCGQAIPTRPLAWLQG